MNRIRSISSYILIYIISFLIESMCAGTADIIPLYNPHVYLILILIRKRNMKCGFKGLRAHPNITFCRVISSSSW